jgi:hypothetical protein
VFPEGGDELLKESEAKKAELEAKGWKSSPRRNLSMATYGTPAEGDVVVQKTPEVCLIKRVKDGIPKEELGNDRTPEYAVAKACKIASVERVDVWLTTDEFGYERLASFS